MLTIHEINSLATEYAEKHPKEIIALALESTENLSISFSGAEDIVLIDLAVKLKKDVQVFTLDTGRLHAETYAFINQVCEYYGLAIDIMTPDAARLGAYVKDKGLYDFYNSGHHECCGIRKLEPLKRRLENLDGWITGQRKDQSPSTRNDVATIELDSTFSTPDKPLLKFNPLANWSSKQVWEHIRMFDLPYNSLHDRGYMSIGCEPCTKAINPGQHEREGRWWWEEKTAKECGIHQSNIIAKD